MIRLLLLIQMTLARRLGIAARRLTALQAASSTTTSSMIASPHQLASLPDAASAMPPTANLEPRTARRPACLVGASRAALTARLQLSQRQLWTAALASPLALPLHVFQQQALALPMIRLPFPTRKTLARRLGIAARRLTALQAASSTTTSSMIASPHQRASLLDAASAM